MVPRVDPPVGTRGRPFWVRLGCPRLGASQFGRAKDVENGRNGMLIDGRDDRGERDGR